MKALGKLLGEFIAWRWFPAVGLCIASLFYVLVVVAIVPDEIGVPVTNARFAKKLAPAGNERPPEAPAFPTAMGEPEAAPPPAVAQVQPAGVVDFGRRGFSPPLERAEAPPPPPPPPPPVAAPPPPVAVTPPPAETPPPGEAPAVPADAQSLATASPPPVTTGMRAMQPFRGGFPFPRNMIPAMPGQPPNGQQPPGGQPPAPPGEAPQPVQPVQPVPAPGQ